MSSVDYVCFIFSRRPNYDFRKEYDPKYFLYSSVIQEN
jgi:hypothetical protein